jgi:hypothetical protein
MLASSSALALIEVEGQAATFVWTPSLGAVDFYTVYLDKNNQGFSTTIVAYVSEPRVTIRAKLGETIRVCVIGWNWNGTSLFASAPSPFSEPVRFVAPGSGGSPPPTPEPTPPPPDPTPPPVPDPTPSPVPDPTPPPVPDPTPPPVPDPTPPPDPRPEASGTLPYDMNGDRRTDLLWLNMRNDETAAWLMDGPAPFFTTEFGRLRGRWRFIGSGDFDGGGTADLLLQWGRDGTLQIWFLGGGWFDDSATLRPPSRCSNVVAIGDFDGDGDDDLLWKCRNKSVVWFMRGRSVDDEVEGPLPAGEAACAMDVDGDGIDEVIWQDPSETVAWWLVGSPLLRSETVGPRMSTANEAVGCGDADGDGLGDVLWSDPEHGETVLWKMAGDLGLVETFELPRLEADWTMDTSGDFDGDGLANEIVVRDTDSGSIEIWALQWNSERTGFDVVSTADPGMGSDDWEVVAP